ncbi:hypothetical protein CN582_11355 [Bacillus wiedmannii]|nr:hypothetical protein CN582_11355 [Bacillus wiedmannii]
MAALFFFKGNRGGIFHIFSPFCYDKGHQYPAPSLGSLDIFVFVIIGSRTVLIRSFARSMLLYFYAIIK